jgi:small subunit ribosomal protein S21|tara:strand:+ start:584 stop:826 length:243 start_codon:yes stop_codon:yes gene_type:complete
MKKTSNISVTARECRDNPEKMIRKFIKKVKKEGILEEIRERRYYKKPSVVKKEKRIRAARRRHLDEQKNSRSKETRNRRD